MINAHSTSSYKDFLNRLMTPLRDIFICHAREDKPSVVRPLAEAFALAGISCWLDEAEIQWGDSITQKVNEGLRTSRYVLVVFSPAFLIKKWPQRELNASLNQESSSGEIRVLPLLVGDSEAQKTIIETYPLMNDKFHLVWQGDTQSVVTALQKRLGYYKNESQQPKADPALTEIASSVYIPPIKRNPTQREKDLFLKSAFGTVKGYFQEALKQLETHTSEIETDFTDIHNQKFVCKIYLRGDIKNQCKIWIGDNMISSNSIAYVEGRQPIDSDNSVNEMAVVEDTPTGLAFALVMSISSGVKSRGLSPQELAEGLWRRFVSPLT